MVSRFSFIRKRGVDALDAVAFVAGCFTAGGFGILGALLLAHPASLVAFITFYGSMSPPWNGYLAQEDAWLLATIFIVVGPVMESLAVPFFYSIFVHDVTPPGRQRSALLVLGAAVFTLLHLPNGGGVGALVGRFPRAYWYVWRSSSHLGVGNARRAFLIPLGCHAMWNGLVFVMSIHPTW